MVSSSTPSASGGDAPMRSRRGAALGHVQPFAVDICANWREVSEEGSADLHARAMEELRVLEAEGRVVLLSAPRAGHGKTHLLGRVARRLGVSSVVATVPWHSADDVSWRGCGVGVLHDLGMGSARGVANLQAVCAGVLAMLLRRLIQTGRIPSTDPAQALRVLAQDPMELFKEGGNAVVIGDWFRRHFEQLRTPLAEVSAQEGPGAVEDWLKGLFDYVDDPSPARLAELEARIISDPAAQAPRFLRLITTWRPLVLVADHMDGLYRDPAAGVAVGRMTVALTALPGVHVVLSVNQDLWETTFGRQLPSALEDRLNAHNVALRGLSADDAKELVILRLREAGVGMEDGLDFLRFLDIERYFFGRPIGSISARGLLRHASQMWRHWLQTDEPTPTTSEPPQVPAESFLMDAPGVMPVPADPLAPEPPAEDMAKLAAHLAADAGGIEVSLTGGGSLPQPASHAAAPPLNASLGGQATAAQGGYGAGGAAAFDLTSPVPLPQAEVGAPFLDESAGKAVAQERSQEPPPSLLSEATPTTFHKLRQMLAKLKVATDSVPLGETASSTGDQAHHGTNGSAPAAAANLQSRYEAIRQEIAASPRPNRLENAALNDLIRLAGRRFPVVNYDEVELPGLLGRSLPRWSVQGMEIVFGLEDFSDSRYWKTVSSFMAGRVAELGAATMAGGQPSATQLKLVVFKGDAEAAGLVGLLREETIPQALRGILDAVHLDPRSLASLYAMQQIIRETESGKLQASTDAVLSALANELDFFWKRITRPRS